MRAGGVGSTGPDGGGSLDDVEVQRLLDGRPGARGRDVRGLGLGLPGPAGDDPDSLEHQGRGRRVLVGTWAVFLLPAMSIVFLVFFWFLPALSHKNFEVDTLVVSYGC